MYGHKYFCCNSTLSRITKLYINMGIGLHNHYKVVHLSKVDEPKSNISRTFFFPSTFSS